MSNATKRIPVTEERWKELHELKEPGQTFDQVIELLIESRKKEQLFKDMGQIRDEENFVPLEEA